MADYFCKYCSRGFPDRADCEMHEGGCNKKPGVNGEADPPAKLFFVNKLDVAALKADGIWQEACFKISAACPRGQCVVVDNPDVVDGPPRSIIVPVFEVAADEGVGDD